MALQTVFYEVFDEELHRTDQNNIIRAAMNMFVILLKISLQL